MKNQQHERRKRKIKISYIDEWKDDFLDIEANFRESNEFKKEKLSKISNKKDIENKTKKVSISNQPVINKELIRNQLVTNKEPISNQLVTNKESIRNQLVTNKESISNQLVTNKESIRNPIRNQISNQLVTNKESISNQIVVNYTFKELSQMQRVILSVIFNDIKYSGEKITGPISMSYIAEIAKTTIKSTRTAVQRLVKKNILIRKGGKRGKGGWAKFSLNKAIYNDMLQSELVTNKESISNQLVTNKEANKEANWESTSPSSNSSIILNTITTNNPDNWTQEIQTPENLKKIGIGISHIKQLNSKFNLTPVEIQKGLEAFSYDLKNGEKERLKARGIQNLVGYFFGAMKSGGYNSVKEGFMTSEDFAEKEMLERLEAREKERKERKLKLEELLFLEWIESKTEKEICEISKPMLSYLDDFHKGSLKNYFLKNEIIEFKKGLL